jgi:hypothetical protein
VLTYAKTESELKNISFEAALFDAAKRVRNRELLGLAVLLADNRQKGSELCEKLERERNRMNGGRLSDAKAKAKKAETKLCFPLMLLLIALVAICVAPAVMNM